MKLSIFMSTDSLKEGVNSGPLDPKLDVLTIRPRRN